MLDSIESYAEHSEGHENSSVSNFTNRGQDDDFIQEEANKSIKPFLLYFVV